MEKMWTAEELAEFLDLSVQTVYHWRWKGCGPKAIKVGRHLRYRVEDVEEWIEGLNNGVA